jgi:hypothetical protein
MPESAHPAAPHDLPSFITAPGETDVLMVVMALILLFSVLGFGILFFRLHSLPERMAHTSQKIQFEIVAVLCLISLFTHMHIFWIAGLLLALIDVPDFSTPLRRIAGSAEKMAGLNPGEGAEEFAPELMPGGKHADDVTGATHERVAGIKHAEEGAGPPPESHGEGKRGTGAASRPKRDIPAAHKPERSHA